MTDWITDPDALDTICAIGAIQPGDEILVRGDDIIHVPVRLNDAVALVHKRPEPGRMYGSEVIVAHVRLEENDAWLLCRKNVKGWRRPHG